MKNHSEQEHPDFTAKARMWKRYRDLYAGGEQFRESAAEYLMKRNKEPYDIYQERLSRVFYENYLGSIIDWYTATLVRRGAGGGFFEWSQRGPRDFWGALAKCELRGGNLSPVS